MAKIFFNLLSGVASLSGALNRVNFNFEIDMKNVFTSLKLQITTIPTPSSLGSTLYLKWLL